MLATLLAMVICGKLIYINVWLFDNDNFMTLSMFFRSEEHPGYREVAQRWHQAAVEACHPENKQCVGRARFAFNEQTYTRPIIAFFGSLLATPFGFGGTAQNPIDFRL
jgi:hypothetical protein